MRLTRYLRLYRIFVRNNVVRELEFRGNFLAKIFVNLTWMAGYALFLQVIFRNTRAVAGWNEGEMFVLYGTFVFSTGLMALLFSINLAKIPEMVRLGTMDFVLTKPLSSQFHVSLRYLSFDELGTLAGALFIFTYGLHTLHRVPTMAEWGGWALLAACGVGIQYALQLFLMTLSFWLVKLDNIGALVDTVMGIGRYPLDIFRAPLLRWGLTFVVPLAFIAYVPALVLKDGVQPVWLLEGIAVNAALLTLARLFWEFATRSYISASS